MAQVSNDLAFLHRPLRINIVDAFVAVGGVSNDGGKAAPRRDLLARRRSFSRRQARARQQAGKDPAEPSRLFPARPDGRRLRGTPPQAGSAAPSPDAHGGGVGGRDGLGTGEQGKEVVAVGQLPAGLEVWESALSWEREWGV